MEPNSGSEGGGRTGRTREHYQQQKSQCYAYFRVRAEDAPKIDLAQFTLYDFINNSFSFSPTKKQLTVSVLEALKQKPMTFNELAVSLDAKKSTLYLLCLALQRSGLIERTGKNQPLRLSGDFSLALKRYSDWWQNWLARH
ncbi:MAG: hypothetical protein AB1626_02495 [Candidatus Micrarchaeota archaeon]